MENLIETNKNPSGIFNVSDIVPETNEIWRERAATFRKLDKQVRRLLKDRRPLESRTVSWQNIFTDLIVDNYHQDMLLGRRLEKK